MDTGPVCLVYRIAHYNFIGTHDFFKFNATKDAKPSNFKI